ncbi:MAG: hypothetical protein ACOYN0_19815 [Phycisphaerales bacterium]
MSDENTQRREALERELRAAGGLDVELALLALAGKEQEDPKAAAAALKAQKPHLFARPAPAPPGAMGVHPAPGDGADKAASELGDRARLTGDRSLLLRFLRARRRG